MQLSLIQNIFKSVGSVPGGKAGIIDSSIERWINMWSIIGTGLVAGIIAAFANILVAHWNNVTQRETTKMTNSGKLVEVMLNWNNETRTLIGKFVENCFKLNSIYQSSELLNKRYEVAVNTNAPKEVFDQITEASNNFPLKEMREVTGELYELRAQIKMHLFNDSYLEKDIIEQVDVIINNINDYHKLPIDEINKLVDLSKTYFAEQWKKAIE